MQLVLQLPTMAQLISTSRSNELTFLCKKSDNLAQDYSEVYQRLREIFGDEQVRFFAKPDFKGNDKINWYIDLDGNIYPLSKASENIQSPYELLAGQANALYRKILKEFPTIDKRREYFDLLDRCLTIESSNDIYLVISPEGQKHFCITNWGSNEKGSVNILASVVDVKKINVTVKITRNGKPLSNKDVEVRIDDAVLKLKSDDKGLIYLKDLDLLSEFTVLQRDGEKIIKKRKYIVDREHYTFEVEGNTIPSLKIKVVDKNGKPLGSVNIEVNFGDKVIKTQSNDKGIVEVDNVPIGSRVIVNQQITSAKKITKSFQITSADQQEIVFRGEKISGNYLVIKVLDVNGQIYPDAEMEIIYGEHKIVKKSNDNGLVIVNDIPLNSEVIIRQVIDGLPSYQRTFVYNGESKELTFRSQSSRKILKDLKINVTDANNKPIRNLSVKLVNGHDWHYAITDKDGVAIFEKINCADETKIEIKYKGKSRIEAVDCKENSEFTFELGGASFKYKKQLLWILIALLVIAGIIWLFETVDFSGIQFNKNESVQDTVEQTAQEALPVVKPEVKVIEVKSLWDMQPVQGLGVKAGKAEVLKVAADSGYFVLKGYPDSVINLEVFAPGFDTLRKNINFNGSGILYLKPVDLYVAPDTTCNSYIISRRVRYYIQTVRFPHKVNSFRFKYIKRFVSDYVTIYRGDKMQMSDGRIIWQQQGAMPDTIITRVELPVADSLVTIRIKAGEATTPSWRYKIYCR